MKKFGTGSETLIPRAHPLPLRRNRGNLVFDDDITPAMFQG
jgi:hypothetical protein